MFSDKHFASWFLRAYGSCNVVVQIVKAACRHEYNCFNNNADDDDKQESEAGILLMLYLQCYICSLQMPLCSY